MKGRAVVCNECGDTIFSRTRHDFHYCSCGLAAIDGGRNYIRIMGNINNWEIKEIEIPQTEAELYNDWLTRNDKYGIIKKGG